MPVAQNPRQPFDRDSSSSPISVSACHCQKRTDGSAPTSRMMSKMNCGWPSNNDATIDSPAPRLPARREDCHGQPTETASSARTDDRPLSHASPPAGRRHRTTATEPSEIASGFGAVWVPSRGVASVADGDASKRQRRTAFAAFVARRPGGRRRRGRGRVPRRTRPAGNEANPPRRIATGPKPDGEKEAATIIFSNVRSSRRAAPTRRPLIGVRSPTLAICNLGTANPADWVAKSALETLANAFAAERFHRHIIWRP